ncbi:MAG: cell division protein FtsA [Chloroflexi bacterium]|nr:cell division protein FtsA [Chloroflexota bacterium]
MARIACINLGSTAISAAVIQASRGQLPLPLGYGWVPAVGIADGQIADLGAARRSLAAALEAAERASGGHVGKAIVGINIQAVRCATHHGQLTLGRDPQVVTKRHATQAVRHALMRDVRVADLLHVIPGRYLVDTRLAARNPLSMPATRLDVDVVTISAPRNEMQTFARCVQDEGLDINEVVYTPLAIAEAVATANERQAGVVVLHIGSVSSTLFTYVQGALETVEHLPIGGRMITNDIAVVLRISLEQAEQMKRAEGKVVCEPGSTRWLTVPPIDGFAAEPIPEQLFTEIIRARVEELFDFVSDRLAQRRSPVTFPAGIVLTGSTALLGGLEMAARERFRIPARVVLPKLARGTFSQKQSWAAIAALVRWVERNEPDLAPDRSFFPGSFFDRLVRRFLPLGGN